MEDLTLPTLDNKYLPAKKGMKEEKLNFTSGTALKCLDSIVQHNDIMVARERIKENQDEGKLLKEKLKGAKRITSGIVIKSGKHRLGLTVLEVKKENDAAALAAALAKRDKDLAEANKKKTEALSVLVKGKADNQWTVP